LQYFIDVEFTGDSQSRPVKGFERLLSEPLIQQ
jgi:hypothetical protein